MAPILQMASAKLATVLAQVIFRARLTLDTEPSSAGEAERFLVDFGAGVCYAFI